MVKRLAISKIKEALARNELGCLELKVYLETCSQGVERLEGVIVGMVTY